MFNFSGSEIVFLLLLALIILGPEKLPDAVRKFGKTYAEFKKVTTGFQTELKSALDEPMREMKETADALRKAAQFDVDLDPKSLFGSGSATGAKADEAKQEPSANAMAAVTPTADEIAAAQQAEPERPPGPNFTSAAPPVRIADNEPPLVPGTQEVEPVAAADPAPAAAEPLAAEAMASEDGAETA